MNTCVCGILEHVWHFCFVYNMIIKFFLNRMIKNLKKVFLSNNQSQSYIIFKVITNFLHYMRCLKMSLAPVMWSALTITLRSPSSWQFKTWQRNGENVGHLVEFHKEISYQFLFFGLWSSFSLLEFLTSFWFSLKHRYHNWINEISISFSESPKLDMNKM